MVRIVKVSPLETHVRNCVHKHITVKNGQVLLETWLFRAEDFPCGSCGNGRNVVFMRMPPINVVIQSCDKCGTTQQVLARDPKSDRPIARLLKTEVISNAEARAFMIQNRMRKKLVHPALAAILEQEDEGPRGEVDLSKLEDVEVEDL